MMKRFIFAVITMLLLAGNAFAYTKPDVDVSGLTEKQIAELKVQAASIKEQNETQVPTVDKASQWVEVGKNAGLALASCAKEIGVAGDTFLNSFTGKVVFGVLIFKMMGGPIVHVIGAFCILSFALPIWFWLWKRKFTVEDIIVDGKLVKREYSEIEGDSLFGALGSLTFIFTAFLVVLLTI